MQARAGEGRRPVPGFLGEFCAVPVIAGGPEVRPEIEQSRAAADEALASRLAALDHPWPSRLSHARACRRTLAGAVPP